MFILAIAVLQETMNQMIHSCGQINKTIEHLQNTIVLLSQVTAGINDKVTKVLEDGKNLHTNEKFINTIAKQEKTSVS